MRQRLIACLLFLTAGMPGLGCGDSKKEGGEAKIVVKEEIPEHLKLQPIQLPNDAGGKPAVKPADH
jgi:hypothetical protein